MNLNHRASQTNSLICRQKRRQPPTPINMKKVTSRTIGLSSEAECMAMIDHIAELTVKRDRLQAKLDRDLLEVREKHGSQIEEQSNMIASYMAQVETFVAKNRSLFFTGDKKSAESTKALFGFRLGNPTLALLSRKFTWKMVVIKLQELGFGMYLKLAEPKPDKDKIKTIMTDEQLASVGLRLEQSESFWVEPKTDSAERLTI